MNKKLYPCKKCGKLVPIRSKGLCPTCRYKERKIEGNLPTYKNKIKPITPKRLKRKKEEKECLNIYFDFHIQKLKKHPYSQESGAKIHNVTRANICHLLPKRKDGGFPSVKCNLDNVIYLTIEEHYKFDKYLDERDFERLEVEFKNTWFKTAGKIKSLLKISKENNKTKYILEEYIKSKNI